MIKTLKLLLRILRTPRCLIRIHKTSKPLSKYINRELDKQTTIKIINKFVAQLGNQELWISNYPYGFGTVYSKEKFGMPDRATVFRLYDAIQKELDKNKDIELRKQQEEQEKFLDSLQE